MLKTPPMKISVEPTDPFSTRTCFPTKRCTSSTETCASRCHSSSTRRSPAVVCPDTGKFQSSAGGTSGTATGNSFNDSDYKLVGFKGFSSHLKKLAQQPNRLQIFFVVLACHYPVLDGFDQHFEASVHFPISIAID